MAPEKLAAACRAVEQEVASGAVGAATLVVARGGVVAVERGYGKLSREEAAPPCRPDSVFLIASITKPLTAMAVMRLVEQGRMGLDDPVVRHLPEFGGADRRGTLVRHLLTHASGLPDMLPDNIALRKRQAPLREFLAGAMRVPLLFPPGARVSYQSMGTLLAAEIAERVSGQRLDAYLAKEVFGPLGMKKTSLGMGGLKIEETVRCDLPASGDLIQTEADRSWNWNSAYWRNLGVPWGGAHSTAGDIALVLQSMLEGGGRVLKPETVRAMITDQNRGLDKPWGLGWKVGKDAFYEGSAADAFGHKGATGTVCWADPGRKLVLVLLTNRPGVNDKTEFRKRVSAMVSAAAVS